MPKYMFINTPISLQPTEGEKYLLHIIDYLLQYDLFVVNELTSVVNINCIDQTLS